MSIIIVGIGDEDFAGMKFLDADEINLVDGKGRACKRDIVQFVEFRQFVGEDGEIRGDSLAESVLNEVPEQLVGYMMENGITTGKPDQQ